MYNKYAKLILALALMKWHIHVLDSHKGWNIQQNNYWIRVESTTRLV